MCNCNLYMYRYNTCLQNYYLFLSSVERLLILSFSCMGPHHRKPCSSSFTNLPSNYGLVMSVVSLLFTLFNICTGTSGKGIGRSSIISHSTASYLFFKEFVQIAVSCGLRWLMFVVKHFFRSMIGDQSSTMTQMICHMKCQEISKNILLPKRILILCW